MYSPPDALGKRLEVSAVVNILKTDISRSKGVGLDGLSPRKIPLMADGERTRMAEIVVHRLRSETYCFTPYREFLVTKGRGVPPRVIAIPTIRDRLALKILSQLVGDAFGIHGPPLPQDVVSRVARETSSGRYPYFVKLDVQQYFDSIDHDFLLRELKRRVRTASVTSAVLAAVKNPTVPMGHRCARPQSEGGIPQGASLSSVLAEVFLSYFDTKWKSRGDLTFFRFVDDILILTSSDPEHIFSTVQTELWERYGLSCHPLEAGPLGKSGKSSIGSIDAGFDYLGYRVSSRGVSIGPAAMARIEKRLAATVSRCAPAGQDFTRPGFLNRLRTELSIVITGIYVDGTHRGWMRFYSQTQDLKQLFHLDALVVRLLDRRGIHVESVRPPKFVKTWHIIQANSRGSGYIQDVDSWPRSRRIDYLVDVRGIRDAARYENARLNELFSAEIHKEVRYLEQEARGGS